MNYQMVGIVAVGDVSVKIHHNLVGASMAQATVVASSIQLNKHAIGSITHNIVVGNQWLAGDTDSVGTAILILDSDNAIVSHNEIGGNSDIGIYVVRVTQGTFDNNKVFDIGPDGPYGPDEVGIANDSDLPGSAFTNNKVRGFTTPYDGIEPLGSNKVIPP
jgi:parallel beta-helix repeat protein